MPGGMQGIFRKHAGVPHPAPAPFQTLHFVLNIKTVTGRTEEGAGSASQARIGNIFPKRAFPKFRQLFRDAAGIDTPADPGGGLRGELLCCFYILLRRILQQFLGGEFNIFPFFRKDLQQIGFSQVCQKYIQPFCGGRATVDGSAKTVDAGLQAGEAYEGRFLTSLEIVGIVYIPGKNAVHNGHGPGITGPDTQNYRLARLLRKTDSGTALLKPV